MISEVILPPEGLAADVTRKRPLVRMRPDVDEQVVGLGEASIAETADVVFRPLPAFGYKQKNKETFKTF